MEVNLNRPAQCSQLDADAKYYTLGTMANARDSLGPNMKPIPQLSKAKDSVAAVCLYPTNQNRKALFSKTLLPAVRHEDNYLKDDKLDLKAKHAERKKAEEKDHARHKPPDDEDELEAEERMTKALFEAVENDDEEEIDELVEAGARLDAVDWLGRTALLQAAASGQAAATEKLLSLECRADFEDHAGGTALMWAAGNGHGEVVEQLLAADGCEVNHVNKEGESSLLIASEWGHLEV